MRRPGVTLRPASEADGAFLRALFLDAHPELAMLEMTGHAGLVDLQLAAQRKQYCDAHPDAVDHVVVVDATAVGRCWTSGTTDELRLLDLVVHSVFRRAGIGAAVVDELCRQAADAQIALRLWVWAANEPARRLYASAGLREVDETDGYVLMEWTAQPAESIHGREAVR